MIDRDLSCIMRTSVRECYEKVMHKRIRAVNALSRKADRLGQDGFLPPNEVSDSHLSSLPTAPLSY